MPTARSLDALRKITEEWLEAEVAYRTLGTGEKRAETAFQEFTLNLDGKTVLDLIDGLKAAQRLADAFMWLAENRVARSGAALTTTRHELMFGWVDDPKAPRTLLQAVEDEVSGKSAILRA